MTKLIQLTKFHIETDWNQGVPTNTEKLTPVYINPDLVQLVQIYPYFVPKVEKDGSIDKVMITFGMDMDIIVNESLEEVLEVITR